MTDDPVDLSAHRGRAVQEEQKIQRQRLHGFQVELASLQRRHDVLEKSLNVALRKPWPETLVTGDRLACVTSPGDLKSPLDPANMISLPTASQSRATALLDASATANLPALEIGDHVANRTQFLRAEQPADHLDTDTSSTAVVYCEGNFGAIDGKTANGLVRHSELYDIVAVIDSTQAGLDAGVALGEAPNAIPICRDLAEVLTNAERIPDWFIFGLAPSSGMLSTRDRNLVIEAMNLGMNIVSGLHEFLNDDPEFARVCAANGVRILDVRKPRAKKDLRSFSGRIHEVTCPRIAILGTDCAIGKRTTGSILTRALNDRGVKAVMVGTGQTGLMQGARYGIALDAVPSQFCTGELEATIVDAFEQENPDVIIIEGQGALSHPAYSTSALILRGSVPDGVVLQHAPHRKHRCDYVDMPMPTPSSEIHLIQTFAHTKVIGLTINHEDMTDPEISAAIELYQKTLGIPATDALARSPERLVEMVCSAFPELQEKLAILVE